MCDPWEGGRARPRRPGLLQPTQFRPPRALPREPRRTGIAPAAPKRSALHFLAEATRGVAIRLLSALEAEGTSGDATDCSDSIPRQRPQSVKQAADFRCVRI